jgi:8-amino-7-oxononanoate synthase
LSFEADLEDQLAAIDAAGLRRRLRDVDGAQGARLLLDNRSVLNFSSNNYLGLANHPALSAAVRAATAEFGVGSGASRLIAGNLHAHRRLETALASFHERPSALLFNSGYQANIGVLQAIAGPDDVIFSDALNHASLIDGCRLSRARVIIYRHTDLGDLATKLASSPPSRRRLVVTDTIFSMDGDVAPLPDLRRLCDHHDAVLIIDEAHATGALGPRGRGIAALQDVTPDVHLATLSKGFGVFGAYATGSRALVEILLHRARSFVFTTALPPAVAAAADAALRIIQSEEGDRLRTELAARCAQLAAGLRSLRLLAPSSGSTPIFPILVGDPGAAMSTTEALLAAGIYVQAVRPPTVPAGTARLRFTVMATHTPADIDRALDALSSLPLPLQEMS